MVWGGGIPRGRPADLLLRSDRDREAAESFITNCRRILLGRPKPRRLLGGGEASRFYPEMSSGQISLVLDGEYRKRGKDFADFASENRNSLSELSVKCYDCGAFYGQSFVKKIQPHIGPTE